MRLLGGKLLGFSGRGGGAGLLLPSLLHINHPPRRAGAGIKYDRSLSPGRHAAREQVAPLAMHRLQMGRVISRRRKKKPSSPS